MPVRRILWAAVLVVSSGAATARAELLDRTRFKGNQAGTSFTGSATITCEDGSEKEFVADGFVSGSQSVAKARGSSKTAASGIFVSASFFNGCTGESRLLFGAIAGGFDASGRNLNRARLEGSTLLHDFSDGAQVSFELELEIEGVGELLAGKTGSHTKTEDTPGGPIVITNTLSAVASRDGLASGTIRLGGVLFAPEFSFTSLSVNRSAEIRIER